MQMPVKYSETQKLPDGFDVNTSNFLAWTPDNWSDECKSTKSDRTVVFMMGLDRHGELNSVYKPLTAETLSLLKGFIANGSNELKNFSPIYVDGRDFGMAYLLAEWDEIPDECKPKTALRKSFFKGTHLEDAAEAKTFGLCLIPTVVPGFAGQLPIQTNLDEPNFEDEMKGFSVKHGLWAELITQVFGQYRSTEYVATVDTLIGCLKALGDEAFDDYLHPDYNLATDKLVPDTAPFFTFSTFTKRTQHQDVINEIANVFKAPPTPTLPRTGGNSNNATSNTSGGLDQAAINLAILDTLNQLKSNKQQPQQELRVITKADEERQAVVSGGLVRLKLFMVQGTVNFQTGEVTNLQLPEFSDSFADILAGPAAGRTQLVQCLLQTIFTDIPDKAEDRRDPMFKSLSMKVFTTAFVTNLLDCNIATEELTSLTSEGNAINILSFLGQSIGDSRVKRAVELEEKLKNEIRNQVDPVNRAQMKLTMQILGGIESMDDITPLAANVNGCCRAIFKQTTQQSIIYQIMNEFVDMIENREFIEYYEKTMHDTPNLHLVFLQAMSHIQNKLSKFSKNIVNVSIARTSEENKVIELPNIKSEHVIDAARYISRFFTKQKNHRADLTIETTSPRFASTSVMELANLSIKDRGSQATKKKAEDPPTPTIPETKKQRLGRNGAAKPTAGAKKEESTMGLFHFKEKDTKSTDCFPKDLVCKPVCGKFCVHGRKCPFDRLKCRFGHYARWGKIPPEDQIKILKAMDTTKLFWFDKVTMEKQKVTLPTEYAHLLGDASGPARA